MESESKSMDNKIQDMSSNNFETTVGQDVCEPSITIELQLSSNHNNPSDTNSGLILIPGYLLVKSSTDSGTYHLQQTVMQIDVDSDHRTAETTHTQNIQLSLESALNQNPVPMARPLEQTIVNNNCTDISNNNIMIGVITRSKVNKRKVNTSDGKKKSEKTNCILNEKNQKVLKLNEIERNDRNKSNINELNVEKLNKRITKSNTSESMSNQNERHLPPSRLVRINCPVCDKQFKKTYLNEHMKIHENQRPYKCLTCGKTYRWRTLLRNHKKTHLANNPFTCPVCDLRMSSKFSVQQHVLKVHENAEKKFECSKCTKKYVTIHQLRAHEKFHSEDRTRQCEYCGKVYKHIASLERHRRLHKGEENSLDLRLKCSACGLICHSKTHYTAHQRIHTGEKPFCCESCGKTYRQIAQLNQHKIVHTDLRPFQCSLCERTFRCRSNLQLHLDHHRGEKRHTCSHCNQKFFSYPNMLKHIRRNHLGLRPFKCQLCENKSFCEKQELQNHMRTHTGEKRPTPKRKRLPLPIPPNDKSVQLVAKQVEESLPSNDSTQTTNSTLIDSQTTNEFPNYIENTIIYEISETQ